MFKQNTVYAETNEIRIAQVNRLEAQCATFCQVYQQRPGNEALGNNTKIEIILHGI